MWNGYKFSTIKKSKNKQPEYELQKAVCKYLSLQHSDIFYNGSAGGMRTFMSVAKKMKATGYKAGFPDLFLYEARKGYNGLAIELKVKGNYAKKNQKDILEKLRQKGYKAEICTGLDQTIETINQYLSDET